eukprot:8282299-Prorocentrum_lima.AAC.1
MATASDTFTVTSEEVQEATGTEAKYWKMAVEKEFIEKNVNRSVLTVSTHEERRAYGPRSQWSM